MKEPLSDFPEDNPIFNDPDPNVEDCVADAFDMAILDLEISIKDHYSSLEEMERLYKKMELYYRIKLLYKTINEQIFGKK